MDSSSEDDDLPDLLTLFPSLRGLSQAKTETKPPEDPSIADRINKQIHLATKFRLQNIVQDDLQEKLKSIAVKSVVEKGSGEDSDASESSSNSEEEPTSPNRVFRVIDFLQFFGQKDAIPSVCGFRLDSDQLTRFERYVLSLEVDELHAALPSLLMSCHPHCISDLKSFLTFLLRVISVSNDASSVLACQTCLVEMLNRHPLAKQARITSLELFPVLFNYGTDVKGCPLIKQVCGLKSHLSKFYQIKTGPGREIPGNWTYNFEFLLKSVAKIVSTCLVEVEDLCSLVIFFMWISLDREVYSSSLYSVLQHCIASSIRRMPVTENPLEHAMDVAVTVSCIDFSGGEEKLSTLASLAESVPGSDKQCCQLKKVLAFFTLNLACSGTIDDMPCECSLDELKLLLCRLKDVKSEDLLLTAAKLIDMCTCRLDPSAAKGLDSFCSDLQKFELSLPVNAFWAKSRLCELNARLRAFFRETVGIFQTFQKEKANSPLSFKRRALSPVKADECGLKTSRPRENELISSLTPEKGELKRKIAFIDEGEESVSVKVAKRMASDVSSTKTSITPINMIVVHPREQSPADIETLTRTAKNIPESVKERSTSHPSRNLEASSPSSCISFDSPGSEQRPFTALRTQSFGANPSHSRSTGHLPNKAEGSSSGRSSLNSLESQQRHLSVLEARGVDCNSTPTQLTSHPPKTFVASSSSPASMVSPGIQPKPPTIIKIQGFGGKSTSTRSTSHPSKNVENSSHSSTSMVPPGSQHRSPTIIDFQGFGGKSTPTQSTSHPPRDENHSPYSNLASPPGSMQKRLTAFQAGRFDNYSPENRSTSHAPKNLEGSSSSSARLDPPRSKQRPLTALETGRFSDNSASIFSTSHPSKNEGSSPSSPDSLDPLRRKQRPLTTLNTGRFGGNSTPTRSTGHHPRNVEAKSPSNFAISYSSGSQQITPSTLKVQLLDDSSLIRMRLQPVVRACSAAGHSSLDLDSSRRGTIPTQVFAENPTVTSSTNHIRENGFVSSDSSRDCLDLPSPQQRPQSIVEARLPEVNKANILETVRPEHLRLTNDPQGLNSRTGLTHESNCLVLQTVDSNNSDSSSSLVQSSCDRIADNNSNASIESVNLACRNSPVFYSSISRDLWRNETVTNMFSEVPRTVRETSDIVIDRTLDKRVQPTVVDCASSDGDSTDGIEVLEVTASEKRNVSNSVPSLPVIESSKHHGALGFSSDDEVVIVSSPVVSSKRRYPRSIAAVGNKGERLSKRSTNQKVVESGKSFKSRSPKQQETFQPEVFVLDETDDSENDDFTILKEVISSKKVKEERTSSGTSYSFPLCSGLVALEIPSKGDVVKHSSKRSGRKKTKKPEVDVITLDSDDDGDRSGHGRSSDSPTAVASIDRSSPVADVQSPRRRPSNALPAVEAEEDEVGIVNAQPLRETISKESTTSDTEDAANKQSSGRGTSCLNPGVSVFEATKDELSTVGAQPSRKRPSEDSTTIDGCLSDAEDEASKQSSDRASRKESAGDSVYEAEHVAEKAYSAIRMFPMNSAVEDVFTSDDVAGSSSPKLPKEQKSSYGFAVENASDGGEIVRVKPLLVQASSQEPVEKKSFLSHVDGWIKKLRRS